MYKYSITIQGTATDRDALTSDAKAISTVLAQHGEIRVASFRVDDAEPRVVEPKVDISAPKDPAEAQAVAVAFSERVAGIGERARVAALAQGTPEVK